MIGRFTDRIRNFFRTYVRHSLVFVRGIRRWLWRARFFVVLASPLILPVGVFVWQPEEDAIRNVGLILQLLGISEVVFGIGKTRKKFGKPGLFEKFWSFLADFPKYGRSRVVGLSAAFSASSAGRVRATKSRSVGPDATIEERVEALEANLKYAREEISETETRIDREVDNFKKSLKEEAAWRDQADKEIKQLLADAHTGGLDISLAGAVYLILGVIMATIPKELAFFFT